MGRVQIEVEDLLIRGSLLQLGATIRHDSIRGT